MSSGTKRSGPSSPPILIDGMRPAFAASYSQERETPRREARSVGLSSGWLSWGGFRLILVLAVSAAERPTSLRGGDVLGHSDGGWDTAITQSPLDPASSLSAIP